MQLRILSLLLLSSLVAGALPGCAGYGDRRRYVGSGDDDDDNGGNGTEVLFGDGSHSLDSITLTVIARSSDDLDIPRDIAFHPDRPDELWVVNRGDDSLTVLFDPGTSAFFSQNFASVGNNHFLAQPSSIAFSDNGNFATIHETDDFTQGPGTTPADFMGPTLWSSNMSVVDGGHGGHLDMLHNSPNGMGIAWQEDNTFWVFDGYHSAISRYAFHGDHGPGGADHSDGEMLRYVEGEVGREANVPSHMELDHDSGLLYIADTGNRRIAVLDTATGVVGGSVSPNYDGVSTHREVNGAEIDTLVDFDSGNMGVPSGLALRDGVLYVSDNSLGIIWALGLNSTLVDWIDLERSEGALMGIAFDESGRLYVVDAEAEEILRIDPGE
jgi:sugar lactone lactonase YvrE